MKSGGYAFKRACGKVYAFEILSGIFIVFAGETFCIPVVNEGKS